MSQHHYALLGRLSVVILNIKILYDYYDLMINWNKNMFQWQPMTNSCFGFFNEKIITYTRKINYFYLIFLFRLLSTDYFIGTFDEKLLLTSTGRIDSMIKYHEFRVHGAMGVAFHWSNWIVLTKRGSSRRKESFLWSRTWTKKCNWTFSPSGITFKIEKKLTPSFDFLRKYDFAFKWPF